MDCHPRYVHEEFCIVVSLLSQPFSHDRWPCDHPQVVFSESLPLLHIRASWSAFVFGSLSHFKRILRNARSLMKPTRNEMEYALGLPFTTCRSLLTVLVVSANQNWKRVCVFLSQETVIKSYDRSRSLSSSSSNSSIQCCPPTNRPSTQAAHQLL